MTKKFKNKIFKNSFKISRKDLTTIMSCFGVTKKNLNKEIQKLEDEKIIFYDDTSKIYIPFPSNFFIGKLFVNEIGKQYITINNKECILADNQDIDALPGDEVIFDMDKSRIVKIKSRKDTTLNLRIFEKDGVNFFEVLNGNSKYPVFFPEKKLKKFNSGDVISVTLDSNLTDGKYNAKFKKFLYNDSNLKLTTNKFNQNLVCEVHLENGIKTLVPIINTSISYDINVDPYEINKYSSGDRLLISLNDIVFTKVNATIEKYICNSKDNDANTASLCANYGFPTRFSEEAKNELKNISDDISMSDKLDRIDYTNENFVTIDGSSTKDRDDAVCVTKTSDGKYILKVAISDVSHYVKPGSALFSEAIIDRGNSVYTAGSVNPMLPHKLSSDICSLDENLEKLVKVIEITYLENGTIIDRKFNYGIIKSRKAMTYEAINNYLENNVVLEGYETFINQINLFSELTDILLEKSNKRGSFSFNSDELDISVDENKKTINVKSYKSGFAQKIIEQFMIEANNNTSLFFEGKISYLNYRVHPEPDYGKLKAAIDKLRILKINYLNDPNFYTNENLNNILKVLPDNDQGLIATNLILSAFNRAKYSVHNKEHFGLGFENNYLHFTSPIRRSSDFLVHTAIDLYYGKLNRDELVNFKVLLSSYTEISTKKELDAEKVERASNNLRTFEYLTNNDIKNIKMTISKFRDDYLLVEKKGMPAGIVPYENFPSDTKVNVRQNILYFPSLNKKIKLFDKLELTPTSVSEQGIIYAYNGPEEENHKQNFNNHTRNRRI